MEARIKMILYISDEFAHLIAPSLERKVELNLPINAQHQQEDEFHFLCRSHERVAVFPKEFQVIQLSSDTVLIVYGRRLLILSNELEEFRKYNKDIVVIQDRFLENQFYVNTGDEIQAFNGTQMKTYNYNGRIDLVTRYHNDSLLLISNNKLLILGENQQEYLIGPNVNEFYFGHILMIKSSKYMCIVEETQTNMELLLELRMEDIKQLSMERIRKIFLLDLIENLPQYQMLCLWKSDDFDCLKSVLIGNLQNAPITAAILFAFKHEPVHVIGIVRYLDLVCQFMQISFDDIMMTIVTQLPGFRILNQQQIKKYSNYLNYIQQPKASDEETAWSLFEKYKYQ